MLEDFFHGILLISADSLSQWLSERTLTPGAVLPSFRVSELFETFSLKPYLKSSACDAASAPYTGGTNGWKNG